MDPVFPNILGLVSSGAWPQFSWLDGGQSEGGWLGLEPDLVVEADDLSSLEAIDREWRADPSRIWIGWLTYDLGAAKVLGTEPGRGRLAGLAMRRFGGALELKAGGAVEGHGTPRAVSRILEQVRSASAFTGASAWPLGPLTPTLSPEAYRERIERARDHIRAGDTSQVNLSQRLRASFVDQARPLNQLAAEAFARLRDSTPAGMGALMRAPTSWIVSNSPETLVDIKLHPDGDVARSWPIKGTRPRASSAEDDEAAAEELLASTKDRAEHVMIVDLVHNDLGRLARPGTVRAPSVPELVSLPTVHHLVSEVSCTLHSDWSLRSLVEAVFPGGSITGAPKRRTMEIIDELEGERREIYCGAIVVLHPAGLRMSIPIRTGLVSGEGLELRTGGGIVIDSVAEDERLETLAKARAFEP